MFSHAKTEDHDGRRDFLRTCWRAAAVGGLAALTAEFARRPGAATADCEGRGVCSRCLVEPDCDLPLALAYRQQGERPADG